MASTFAIAPARHVRSAADFARGLEAALEARAPGVYASTPLVCELAVRLGRALGLDSDDLALLDISARIRDIGMIGLPDRVVRSTEPLSPDDWELVNQHPALGAELLAGLPAMKQAQPIVRGHHERWDGGGYPDGHSQENIPLLSRVIAACDAFVAIASDRPHRQGIGAEAALEHLRGEQGSQLDPQVVQALIAVLTKSTCGQAGDCLPNAARSRPRLTRRSVAAGDLIAALARHQVLPAFRPAVERLLAATATADRSPTRDLVATVESDLGLTVAILRAAQTTRVNRPITNIPEAVRSLTHEDIEHVVQNLPRASFPWRTQAEMLLHQLRVHSQVVSRAAERIARETQLTNPDDLLTLALLHDVGKLPLAHTRGDPAGELDPRSATPENRVKAERRTVGLDHASLGRLLLTRWELPTRLADTVATHHRACGDDELATLLRLADMIAHHAHGDAIDRELLVRLAAHCGLSISALRDTLFDLPHTGGSRRNRAEPSPLTKNETAVLRELADGKVYKEIGRDLDRSTSTIRTHAHTAYQKLGVIDRAQAVLRATELGWI
jgi:putative nucleotidyltransferase with HDIG domain